MQRPKYKSFLISMLLHAAFLAAFVMLFSSQDFSPPKPPAKVLMIDLENDSGSGTPRTQRRGEVQVGPRKNGLPDGVFLGLVPRAPTDSEVITSPNPNPSNPAYDVAEGMTLQEADSLEPFMRALWHKIENGLGYPEYFSSERITGRISAQIYLNPDGTFTGALTRRMFL